MKKLIGAIAIVAVIGIAGIAVAVMNLDAYLNDNKAWIVEQIESALERPVDYDRAGVSFSRGLAVNVRGLRVGEDANFGEGDFLNVGQAEVRVALWPALFGDIEVNRIALRDVSVTVIQTAAGLSTDSIGGVAGDEPEMAPAPDAPQGESEPGAAETFTVALAEIRSGRVHFIDRTATPTAEVVVEQLEFQARDFGLDRPLDFRLSGEVLGEQDANVHLAGQVGPMPKAPGSETPVALEFSLDPILVEQLRSLPGMADALDPNLPLDGTMNLAGTLRGSIENPKLELSFDATDALVTYAEDGRKDRGVPLGLDFDVAMVGKNVEIKSADFELEGVKLHASGRVENIDDPIVDLLVQVFDGEVAVDGGWNQDGVLDLKARVDKLELAEVAKALSEEAAEVLGGRLSMELVVSGNGKTWDELKPGLEGLGSAKIEGGVLHDINLVEEALGGLTGIPGLSAKLPSKMSDKYPSLFSSGETEFETMEGKVEVREGRVHILGIEFDAKDFAMKGWGSVSLDGDLDMNTRLVLAEALSDDLIDEAKPLGHLRGKEGLVEIPITLTGTLPEIKARPDTDMIAKKLGGGAAKDLVDKSISKLVKKKLKKKKKKSSAPASADDGRELLEDLLR